MYLPYPTRQTQTQTQRTLPLSVLPLGPHPPQPLPDAEVFMRDRPVPVANTVHQTASHSCLSYTRYTSKAPCLASHRRRSRAACGLRCLVLVWPVYQTMGRWAEIYFSHLAAPRFFLPFDSYIPATDCPRPRLLLLHLSLIASRHDSQFPTSALVSRSAQQPLVKPVFIFYFLIYKFHTAFSTALFLSFSRAYHFT